MKKITPGFWLIALAILVLQSCSATKYVHIPVKLAPQLVLPENIKTLGIANRALPGDGDGSKVVNVIEGVMSGEGINEDRNGGYACLRGVQSQLNIDAVAKGQLVDSLLPGGTGTSMQPLPLDWGKVESICKANKVDALLALEVFDTDQSGSTTTNAINQVGDVIRNGSITPPRSTPSSRVYVKMAWRLYDYQSKTILDDIRLEDYFGVSNTGNVVYDLGEFSKRDAIQQSGYLAGQYYARRLLPSWTRITRDFYKRKGDAMERATRLADVNKWENAMAIWEKLVEDPNNKIARRACYNMAIGYEVLGELELAYEWAQAAWAEHGEKRALDYSRALKRRLNGYW